MLFVLFVVCPVVTNMDVGSVIFVTCVLVMFAVAAAFYSALTSGHYQRIKEDKNQVKQERLKHTITEALIEAGLVKKECLD